MYCCDHCKMDPTRLYKMLFVKPSHKRGTAGPAAVNNLSIKRNILIVDPGDWYYSPFAVLPGAYCLLLYHL